MPSVATVTNMLHQGDWLCSVDLLDAYLHLRMRSDSCPYFQFSFEGRHFMYLVLPNGIALGPWVFMAITKAITTHLRKLGINIVIYIDDTLLIDRDPGSLAEKVKITLQVFRDCGFTINLDKSSLEPKQRVEFLGFILDTDVFTITLTPQKQNTMLIWVRKLMGSQERCKTQGLLHMKGKWNV